MKYYKIYHSIGPITDTYLVDEEGLNRILTQYALDTGADIDDTISYEEVQITWN